MEKEFKDYFGIPENLTPTCMIPIGYPSGNDRNKHGNKSRLPVEERSAPARGKASRYRYQPKQEFEALAILGKSRRSRS